MFKDFNTIGDKKAGYQSNVPILMIFDNTDILEKEFSQMFETRLIDCIRKNSGVRFMTSSSKNWIFWKFQNEYTYKNFNCEIKLKMATQIISALNSKQAVDLLLSTCTRSITK